MTTKNDQGYLNEDVELFRETPGDYYSSSLHKTKSGSIGINVGGYVIVRPLSYWHRLAKDESNEERSTATQTASTAMNEDYQMKDDRQWVDSIATSTTPPTPPSEILGASQEVKEEFPSWEDMFKNERKRHIDALCRADRSDLDKKHLLKEIEHFTQRVGDLAIERDVAREEYQGKCDHIQSLESENGQLKQKVKRYEEALDICTLQSIKDSMASESKEEPK